MKAIGGSDVCETCAAHCVVIGDLEAELAEAKARLAELAAQRPATLQQRIEALEVALRHMIALAEVTKRDREDEEMIFHATATLLGAQ